MLMGRGSAAIGWAAAATAARLTAPPLRFPFVAHAPAHAKHPAVCRRCRMAPPASTRSPSTAPPTFWSRPLTTTMCACTTRRQAPRRGVGARAGSTLVLYPAPGPALSCLARGEAAGRGGAAPPGACVDTALQLAATLPVGLPQPFLPQGAAEQEVWVRQHHLYTRSLLRGGLLHQGLRLVAVVVAAAMEELRGMEGWAVGAIPLLAVAASTHHPRAHAGCRHCRCRATTMPCATTTSTPTATSATSGATPAASPPCPCRPNRTSSCRRRRTRRWVGGGVGGVCACAGVLCV